MSTVLTSRIKFLLAAFALGMASAVSSRADTVEQTLSRLESAILERRFFSSQRSDFRDYAVAALLAGREQRAIGVFGRYFRDEFKTPRGQLGSQLHRQTYVQAADSYLLLQRADRLARGAFRRDPAATRWLFSSNERLALFVDTVSTEDNWPEVVGIIRELHAHDPRGRDRFFELILALAVVWDQPRPAMHPQMGPATLPYRRDITARYEYFRNLYTHRDAKTAYRDLSVTALTFVVDVPVPLGELEWIRENVRGSARNWGEKFFEIGYVDDRVRRGAYVWPHGAYTLANIRQRGGICVDQGYYATMTARAYGIPALFFVGQGRRGPHAWFGYMRDSRNWEMDTGRYAHDNYAQGFATNPQTNQPMTDHEVDYICQRAARPMDYRQAAGYARIGEVLLELGSLDAAFEAAERSVRTVRIFSPAWDIMAQVHARRGDHNQLLNLFDRKAMAFRDHPDFTVAIRRQQAHILRQLGREAEADALLRRYERRVGSDRDDLGRLLLSDQIDAAYREGNPRKARAKFEDLLDAQRDEGVKLVPILRAYIEFSRQTEQAAEAAQFLRRYVSRLERRYSRNPDMQIVYLTLLLQAYENAGEDWRARDVRRKIDRLRG